MALDSEFARLSVLCSGRYAPTQESGLGSATYFPDPIISQEPHLVFCRPDTQAGLAGLTAMYVIGGPNAWTGFYVRAYSSEALQPDGRWFAAAFMAQASATCGMRLWDGTGRLVFDSGTPPALFTRALANGPMSGPTWTGG